MGIAAPAVDEDPAAPVAPHAATAFPMRALLAVAALTLMMIAGAGWIAWRLHVESIGLVRTELRLRDLAGQIMRLDEVLTMSARMAASTGDLKWEERYREFEPQLDAAIKEAVGIAPEAYLVESASDTDVANQKLVAMENRGFELVRAHRAAEATEVLFSDEYAKQKAIYAGGMSVSNRVVDERAAKLIGWQQRRLAVAGVVLFVVLAALAFSWARIVALIRRYLRQTAEAEHALASANASLEHRVVERTRELNQANEHLEARVEQRTREIQAVESELRQAQKLEAVGRLASGVAHEINTPVQFVSDSVTFVRSAFVDMVALVDRYEALRQAAASGAVSPEVVKQAARAREDADVPYLLENVPRALERSIDGLARIADIVRSLKEFAHRDQKEMASVELNQCVRSTLTIARNEYKYVAELVTDLGELPPVTCHAGEINQAVLNIVVNAAHAVGDVVGDSGKKGCITVRTRREGDCAVISISDTGTGIPSHVQERMFEPFFTTKPVGKGTGQGLAIARSVLREKHGGDLTFETVPGKGTTFFLRIPIDGPPAKGGAGGAAEPAKAELVGAKA